MRMRAGFAWRVLCLCAGLGAGSAWAQPPVTVRVDLAATQGPYTPVYRWFGYDEPNYTYSEHGQQLLRQLHELSPQPVYIRAHNLFTTGDGLPALKWGSTNVYTVDARGNAIYDWSILDRIFDAYAAAQVRPMIELGFMPEALSTHPEPYHVQFPENLFLGGWSYPPKDYGRWQALVQRFAQHLVDRYGRTQVQSWYWEVWNEPNIGYWKGTLADYERLYDFSVAGVRKVLPEARVGGPATTGPNGANAGQYLRDFLQHCANGKSAATGGPVPLSFVSFHVKGRTAFVNGQVQMGLANQLQDAGRGFAILREFPALRELPVILSESDPEGCAACSASTHPENGYRNGTLYPTYTAAAMQGLTELADRYKVHLIGMLTWAFEYEDHPYFEGLRTLATHGIDKPEINFFRMAGMMGGQRVKVDSSGAVPLDTVLRIGVRSADDVDGMATRDGQRAAVMLWNYQDIDSKADRDATLVIAHLPVGIHRVFAQQFRIDARHSNSYTAWKAMGSPQNPTAAQLEELKAAGQLQLSGSPEWISADHGQVSIPVHLPSESVCLFWLNW